MHPQRIVVKRFFGGAASISGLGREGSGDYGGRDGIGGLPPLPPHPSPTPDLMR